MKKKASQNAPLVMELVNPQYEEINPGVKLGINGAFLIITRRLLPSPLSLLPPFLFLLVPLYVTNSLEVKGL